MKSTIFSFLSSLKFSFLIPNHRWYWYFWFSARSENGLISVKKPLCFKAFARSQDGYVFETHECLTIKTLVSTTVFFYLPLFKARCGFFGLDLYFPN